MTEEIKTGNEVIAEFMGMPILFDRNGTKYYDFQGSNNLIHSLREHELNYRTSWDWTIPACRKLIADLLILIDELQKQDVIDGDALHEAKRLKANLYHEIACLGLPRVYEALIEAINWYTSNKK